MAELATRHCLPGLTVGVVHDQDLAWSMDFGFANVESEQRSDSDTLYRVGSITKTFTGAAVLQLRDDSKLSLDDPLTRHIAEFASVGCRYGSAEDVTLRRLLTHHSGLIGEPPLSHWETLEFPSIELILKSLTRTEVVIPPDSAFKYSNLAFSLLGEVVARVSGRPYVEYIRAEILEPLGMDSSGFALSKDLRARAATGYIPLPYTDGQSQSTQPILNGLAPAGQLYSTVADLAKWIALQFRTDRLMREGEQVLRGPSLEEMHRPLYMEPDWDTGYCLAWVAQRRGENILLGHSGGIQGFVSHVLFNMKHRIGVVLLANGIGPLGRMSIQILEMVLEAQKKVPKYVEVGHPATMPEDWQRFLGHYIDAMGTAVQVEFRRGGLVIAEPRISGLLPISPTHLTTTREPHVFEAQDGRYAGEPVTFLLALDGTVKGFCLTGGFIFRKLVQVVD